jgi:hypothetical protein
MPKPELDDISDDDPAEAIAADEQMLVVLTCPFIYYTTQ